MKLSRWIVLFLVAISLFLFVSAAFADSTYTVQPGDSLTRIARQFGTTYLALAEANDLEEPYVIQVGQVLIAELFHACPTEFNQVFRRRSDGDALRSHRAPVLVGVVDHMNAVEFGVERLGQLLCMV